MSSDIGGVLQVGSKHPTPLRLSWNAAARAGGGAFVNLRFFGIDWRLLIVTGALLFLAGANIMLSAPGLFRRLGTRIPPSQPTTVIATTGPFDREIIAWTAVANAGISGSDVRDMMLEAVEKRFRATRAPQAIEHLSDNGSAYTARDTRLFAQALNLTPCFTPVASPQSNGMSEAFVKTLKRDYIRIAALPDAETALRLIDGWIEDYNEIHPHSALKMASPRQFIRAKST